MTLTLINTDIDMDGLLSVFEMTLALGVLCPNKNPHH